MIRLFHTSEKSDNKIFQYMLGMQPSDGWMLIDEESQEVTAFLDARYYQKVESKKLKVKSEEYVLQNVLVDKKFTELLSDHIAWDAHIVIENHLPYIVRDKLSGWSIQTYGSDIFVFDEDQRATAIRIQKSPKEIESVQKAIQINHTLWQSIQELGDHIVGMTELEVRGMLIQQAMSLGASGEAFDTIVASGVHSAIPHHRSSQTVIQPGALLIDMWRVVDGYCSDMTRCLWVWENTETSIQKQEREEYEKILNIVQDAHDAALALSEVGRGFVDLDTAARAVIQEWWYGEYFTHSLWHGVGLDVHEAPSVGSRSTGTIQQGMVYTIEPGIYLPGKYGVRRENIVIVE